ncbi:hypothetical protein D4764_07G0008530 [Takifugu flavidus]|uniref:Uncharacterized protein n=1 Tax=Takifugu flavidus TaxID=433684 RepID=A0A5C6MS57_9TELE|nr:hypothetical protein D4764_07G0008530 [Takifugu flavidus]
MAQAPDKEPWRTVVWGRRERTKLIRLSRSQTHQRFCDQSSDSAPRPIRCREVQLCQFCLLHI